MERLIENKSTITLNLIPTPGWACSIHVREIICGGIFWLLVPCYGRDYDVEFGETNRDIGRGSHRLDHLVLKAPCTSINRLTISRIHACVRYMTMHITFISTVWRYLDRTSSFGGLWI